MNIPASFFLAFLFFGSSLSQSEDYTCIWYGQCYTSGSSTYNCPSTTTGQLINNATAQAILYNRCPHFFEDENGEAIEMINV